MDVITEDERESKSSGRPVVKHPLWTGLSPKNWALILRFLSKEEIIQFSTFLRKLCRNYVLEENVFKIAFIEYFGLHPLKEGTDE